MSKGLQLLLSDARGPYIPRDFCRDFDAETWGFKVDDWAYTTCLKGFVEWDYWDAWTVIIDEASRTDTEGNVWTLYQNGDLWAVCLGLMTDKEHSEFFGACRHCGAHHCFGECCDMPDGFQEQDEAFPVPEEVCHVL